MTAFDTASAAIAAARAAPLSRKKAMLAVLLLDAAVDALCAQSGETDILAFRARLAAGQAGASPPPLPGVRGPGEARGEGALPQPGVGSDALALVMALAAMTDSGRRLVVEPVTIPLADYPALATEDFMVSLYNANTVPRVLVALPVGSVPAGPVPAGTVPAGTRDVHEVLAEALSALDRLRRRPPR